MITKSVIRRQIQNGELTNIQTFTYNGDEVISMNLDNTPYAANKMDELAPHLGLKATYEVNKVTNGEIHITTWTIE